MAYPEDQGLIIPQWPGWRLVDWFNEKVLAGDRICLIGNNPSLDGQNIDHSISSANSIWHPYHKSHCVYRKAGACEWVRLDDNEILRSKDIITQTTNPPPDFAKPLAVFGSDGYLMCFSPGYGGGCHTLARIRAFDESTARAAWRAKSVRNRLPPNPPQLTQELPLP